ncbi:MAG TPA: hypothetical protein VLI69_03910 [Gammaproteobacteria bacterium]|nr:hypothetical protein [Gammaproteobacteria bacterium]
MNKNEKFETLYKDFNVDTNFKPWIHDEEKIDIIGLNEIINKYLSYDWFSSPIFEHIIINAYLRYCVELNRKNFIHSPPNSAKSAAACCSTASGYFKTYLFFKIIGIIISWIIPIALIVFTFTREWYITSAILVLLKTLSVGYSLITLPTRIIHRRRELRILSALISLKTYVSGKTWSPTVVINKINELDKELNIPELTPLVGKMINRNAHIFNLG